MPNCWAFRDLVHLFLRVIQRNSSERANLLETKDRVIQSCCINIRELCELLFSETDESAELVRQLPSIIATLVPIAEGESMGSEDAMDTIKYLVITQRHQLEQAIHHLHSFPSTGKWSGINEAHRKVCGKTSFLDEMKSCLSIRSQLADHAISSRYFFHFRMIDFPCFEFQYSRALSHFAEQIRKRKNELYELLYCSSGRKCEMFMFVFCSFVFFPWFYSYGCRTKESMSDHWRLFVTLQWELIQMCSHHYTEPVRHAAAVCLALLGPIDANIVAFSSDQKALICSASSPSQLNNPIFSLHRNILNLLVKYVIDMDMKVVQVASLCLKIFLCQEGSKPLIEKLSPVIQDYLFPFYVSKTKMRKHQETLLGLCDSQLSTFDDWQSSTISSERLWTTQNKCYAQWIRLLAFRLVSEVHDPMFKAVSGMCLFKVDFASFAFPFAVRELLMSPPKMRGKVSPSVLMGLFSQSIKDKENIESLLQVLDCLKFLRLECFLSLFFSFFRYLVDFSEKERGSPA